jgi:hypothetical protein
MHTAWVHVWLASFHPKPLVVPSVARLYAQLSWSKCREARCDAPCAGLSQGCPEDPWGMCLHPARVLWSSSAPGLSGAARLCRQEMGTHAPGGSASQQSADKVGLSTRENSVWLHGRQEGSRKAGRSDRGREGKERNTSFTTQIISLSRIKKGHTTGTLKAGESMNTAQPSTPQASPVLLCDS